MQHINKILSIYPKCIKILIEDYLFDTDDLQEKQLGMIGIDIDSDKYNFNIYINGLAHGGHSLLLKKHFDVLPDDVKNRLVDSLLNTAYLNGRIEIIKQYENYIKGNRIAQAIESMNKEVFDYEYNRIGMLSEIEYARAYAINNKYVIEKFNYEVADLYKVLNACVTDTLNDAIFNTNRITHVTIRTICANKSEKVIEYFHKKNLLKNFYTEILNEWPEKIADLLPIVYESDKRNMLQKCTNKFVLTSILLSTEEEDVRSLYICIACKHNNHNAVKLMLSFGWTISESVIMEAIRDNNNDVIRLINSKSPELMETAVKCNNVTAARHFMNNVNQSIIDSIYLGYEEMTFMLLPYATKFSRALEMAKKHKRKNMLKHILKASKKYRFNN